MKIDLEKIAMLGALGLAAYWLTSKSAIGATVGKKNAAPLIWAQNPTAANPQQPAANKANVMASGLGLLTSIFGNRQASASTYTPTYQSWAPDYSFSTDMLGTSTPASQADMYAMNPPAAYYGLGWDMGAAEGTYWDVTP